MTGLVLAGGDSTRMGRDKATIAVAGVRLVDRAVGVLAEVCVQVLVAARGRVIPDLDATFVADAQGEGPLAGIVAGLQEARTPLVAVLGVDMPHASAGVFRTLAQAWDGGPGVVAEVGGSLQPLHAVYATAFVQEYADLLAAGERSPRQALVTLGATVVSSASLGGSAFAENVNSPADLRRSGTPGPPEAP